MNTDLPDADAPDGFDFEPTTGPGEPEPLAGVVDEREDAPDVLTLYPADAPDETLVTNWISAEDGAYVTLSEMR